MVLRPFIPAVPRVLSWGTRRDAAWAEGGWIRGRRGGRVVRICPLGRIALRGAHNLNNVLAAAAAALLSGVPAGPIRRTLVSFRGLPHRLERVGTLDGVEYINDSKATNPGAAIAALSSFSRPLVWIAGGSDKNFDFRRLRAAARSAVRLAVLVGATKIGVLVALFLSLSVLPFSSGVFFGLGMLVIFLAILTMTAGNLLALNQKDIRYILAYSSVAQMGYILLGFGMGMVYDLELGFTAGLYYAIAYGIMKAGSFLVADLFGRASGSFDIGKMRGIGTRYPVLGIAFAIFVLGLSGVPFTCGFLGKLLLEQAGMVTSMMSGVVLALILALNSFISLGYYVPVLSTLLFRERGKEPAAQGARPSLPAGAAGCIVLLAVVTVYLGLFPESFDWITHAAQQLFPWGMV